MAFDLRSVALSHGWHQIPPFSWDEELGVLAVAVAGPRRSVRRLEMWQPRRRAARSCRLRWMGAGRRAHEQELAGARRLARRVLNLDVDISSFYELCVRRPELRWVVEAGAGRVMRGPSVFSDVVSAICGTNTTWRMAVRSVHRISELAPTDPTGSLRRFPTPKEILDAGASWLRERGRVGYRADYIVALAKGVSQGELDLHRAMDPRMSGRELRALFRSLPGIGPVTARYLAVLYGRYDSLAVDSLVLSYVGDKHFGGRRVTEREVQSVYAPYGDLRGLAYWFEFLGDVDPVTWRGWKRPGKGQ